MLVQQLAQKYAQAIYELAKEKDELAAVEAQLQMVQSAVADNKELATFLYHPRVPAESKKSLLKEVFGKEVTPEVLRFLLLVVDKRRETFLPQMIQEFISLANEERNIAIAEVKTVLPLSEAEQTALKQKLEAVMGKTIVLKEHIDASIIGGMIIKLGDKLIDGSVKRQLDLMKYALLQSQATKIGVTK